jgi:type I restriction enzyme M protein
MVRESLRQRFVTALDALGGSAGNGKLQAELGWQDETYWSIHAALIEDKTITNGRGRGGSVSLAACLDNAAQPSAIAVPAAVTPREPKASPAPLPTRTTGRNGGSMFEQTFKNIDDVLWKEAGCTTELDYTEQTSWITTVRSNANELTRGI